MTPVIQDLPREYVLAAQRRRAVDAVAEIAHEFGLAAATVTAVCRVGRMARATYYGLFDGASGCLRYSFAEAYREMWGPVPQASPGTDRLKALDAAIERLYSGVAKRPLLAELCLVHCHGAPEEAAGSDFEAAVGAFADLLRGARTQGSRGPDPLAHEYLARVVVSLAASRALQGRVDGLAAEGRAMVTLVAAAYPELEGETKQP